MICEGSASLAEMTVMAEGIAKAYPDGRAQRSVLEHVSLHVQAGQVVAVEGPSGCGKTTLLTIIGGLLRPDRGRVVVAGNELDHDRPRDVARVRQQHVGLISQAYGLIEAESVFANITLPLVFDRPRPSKRDKSSAVERTMEWATLNVDPSMKVGKLSRGEKQRVAIARALVHMPSLLVADEPTAALDAATGSRIVARLRAVADQGAGVLVATHDQQVSDVCDVVYRFDGTHLTPRQERVDENSTPDPAGPAPPKHDPPEPSHGPATGSDGKV